MTAAGRWVSPGVSLVLAGWISIGLGCKGGSTTPEPPKPVSVTLNFEVYNHTQGLKSNFSRTAMSDSTITIKVSELNVGGVDDQRIAIRENGFGKLVKFSNTGEAGFDVPEQNTSYDVILFNKLGTDHFGNQASYSWMDDMSATLYLGKKNYAVYRKDRDGVTGPESAWQSVFDQLNSALDLGWVKWGYINRQPSGTSGDFSYGYGICLIGGSRVDGLHGGSFILVDEKWASDPIAPTALGLSEAFENICGVDNIGGYPSSMTIQFQGVLNQVGKDLLSYVFAKDSSR